MTDFFDALLAASGSIHDGLYGETFKIVPCTVTIGPNGKPDPNARKIVDVSRPAQTFIGVWTDPHTTQRPPNRTGHPAGESAAFGDDKPRVDFEVVALPYSVRIGDLVTREKTGARYAVSDPGDDGFTRATIALTGARGQM